MPDIAGAWLSGDHYKWRMMRAMGIDEEQITGSASNYEKYLAWARTAENLIGNPLYHWTHLELQRYFGIYEPLTQDNAPSIWEKANALLKTDELSVKGIFEKFNIYAAGTTDDPVDSLEHHTAIAGGKAPIGKINTKIIPSFRPDKVLDLGEEDFINYIEKLSSASGVMIKSFYDVMDALENRLEFFIKLGCRTADHGLEYVPCASIPVNEVETAFKKAMSGKKVSINESDTYKTFLLVMLASLYHKYGITMQLHISAIRNVNTNFFNTTGPNTGFDAVNDQMLSDNLALLLDSMEASGLPKTILYSLNPKDYYPLATIMGGFQGTGCRGKMQLGSAWWFCDHRDGMEEHLKVLANLGMLPSFIGMLTDSRSFLSFPRHEYFRRILCNLTGGWVENGEYPQDMKMLEKIVKDISFANAKNYFDN
jgi:glucuronate isomerase